MRVLKSKPILVALLAAMISFTGCGKSKSGGANNPNNGYYPQYPGTGGIPGTPGGCYPIVPGSAIPIMVQGAVMDSANFQAQQGQVAIGSGPGGNYFLSGSGSDASISLSVMIQNPMAVGPQQVTGGGQLAITPLRYQVMMQQLGLGYGGYNPYNPYQPQMPQQQQLCVSGLAINLGKYNTRLYGGTVTLFLNGGAGTATLYF